MGVDIYMNWEGKTDDDQQAQYTGYQPVGKVGYLRGAYFGGYSDVLRQLFAFMDWDEETSFDEVSQIDFERNLEELEQSNGKRPDEGNWDHTKGAERGWDLSERQNAPVDSDYLNECREFLNFGKRLLKENKKPTVYISY